MGLFSNDKHKTQVEINPSDGTMKETTYPSILQDIISQKEWKEFMDKLKQAYAEEHTKTKEKRDCFYLITGIVTTVLIIPPIFIAYRYCNTKQKRVVNRLKEYVNPVCKKASSDYDGLTFTFYVKKETEETKLYNAETELYEEVKKDVKKHFIIIKTK